MKASWSLTGLVFFFIIAIFGSIMRLTPFSNLVVEHEHILHSHSHVAFQGWVYLSLFLLISKLYISDDLLKKGKYAFQFKVTCMVILCIMFSFMYQGYGFLSILFSSLFQLLNYWFAFRFFKDVKKSKKVQHHLFSLKFIKLGFRLMILSTIGPWVVGILSAKGMAGSEYFDAALYFFLHFQYNGWFSFIILGVFFWLLEKNNIKFKLRTAKLFYLLFSLAVIPAYSLSLLGMTFRPTVLLISYAAAGLQIVAFIYLYLSLKERFGSINKQFNRWALILLKMVGIAFTFKIFLQSASVFPNLEALAFENRFFIMAYIHLMMIGVISFFLLASFIQLKWFHMNFMINKIGLLLLFTGFLFSELIIVGMGYGGVLRHSQWALFYASLIMAIGILFMLISQLYKAKTSEQKTTGLNA